MKTLQTLILVLASVATGQANDRATTLSDVLASVSSEVRSDDAMDYMRGVYARDHRFTFPQFEKTAAYLEQTLTAAGMTQVEIVRPPADGVTQYGYWTMPLAWDVKRATLEVLEPAPPDEFRLLADFNTDPVSLGMWSGPTPPEGIVAEVVDIRDWGRERIEKLDLSGKVALTSRNPDSLKWLLAKRGAVGAINAFTENPDLRDARQWVNAWGDRGWGFTKDNAPLFIFSITPRQTEWLRTQMQSGKNVRVRAVVDSRYYEGTYPYVTAIIPGTGGAEEVLMLGHTSEPGAQDNATGVAAMIEAAAALNRLIRSGRLARPRRNVRLLAMGELYGTMPYLVDNPERVRNTVAALCLDTPAGFYHLAGTEYSFHLNPQVAASYVDAFTIRLAAMYFRDARPFHEKPYTMGTDTFLADPLIGVPTVWPYSGSGVHTHHNSEDTPDDVDPRSLRDLTVITAAYLYFLANAGDTEAAWLAEIALARSYRNIIASADEFTERATLARDRAALGRLLHDGLEKLDYGVARETQAVESVRRLASKFDPGAMVRQLGALRDQQAERLRDAVNRRAKARVEPAPPPSDPELAEAKSLVVRRNRIGTITLDDLPVEKREGWPSNAWMTNLATAMYWCDGERDLAEVIRLTRLELGPDDFDYVGYFRFLARKGYVELRTE